MAGLIVEGEWVAVRMSWLEHLGAFHFSPVRVARSGVAGAQAVTDLWSHLRGWRAPGTGWPGLIMLGTTRHQGVRDFCAVYRRGPGLVVDLVDQPYARLLVSMPLDRASDLAAALRP